MTKALDIRDASVEWNAYRAHDIETFDTLCLKIKKDDLQIGFWGTLVSDSAGFIEFEAAVSRQKSYIRMIKKSTLQLFARMEQ